jgi:hypothetical protein
MSHEQLRLTTSTLEMSLISLLVTQDVNSSMAYPERIQDRANQ